MADDRFASGIVLAGGRSSRFPTDKLLVPVGGVPLLDRAIAAVSEVASEVLLVGRPGGPPTPTDHPVRLIPDPVPHQGPLAGLVAGLAAATCEQAVVVAGDMPYLDPLVLRLLIRGLDDRPDIDAVTLGLGPAGIPQPLPMAIRTLALPRATAALDGGERSLVRFLRQVPLLVIAESDWRATDPQARSLLDIDRPSDLSGAKQDAPPAAQGVDRGAPRS
jgi:molybdenum cofactor guanylyltransferase